MDWNWLFNFALLIFGFGFVIFWHELGHFLAAKWAGVKVEQFAVGFGQAILSWRKGMGVRVGSSGKEYQQAARQLVDDHGGGGATASPFELDSAADTAGISPTEYRLNWLPLGGYVKMLGQDDLRPGELHEDPRSYNKASVGKRMIIISAGVVMNVILAAILFCALFTFGFNAPPPVLGSVAPGSPAQAAGLQVGDELLTYNGDRLHDYTKVSLAVPLSTAGRPVPVTYLRDGEVHETTITPRQSSLSNMPTIGVTPSPTLQAAAYDVEAAREELGGGDLKLQPEETIVAINGVAVDRFDYPALNRAAQTSAGQPVEITVRTPDGSERSAELEPQFETVFDNGGIDIGGLRPRVQVERVRPGTPAASRLEAGDVILSVRRTGRTDEVQAPSSDVLRETLDDAGSEGDKVDVTIERAGETVRFTDIELAKIGSGQYGLGFNIRAETDKAVVADIDADGPFAATGLGKGAVITGVNGEDVTTWFDVDQQFKQAEAGEPLAVETADGGTFTITPDAVAADRLARNRYTLINMLPLSELKRLRQADNPAIAMWWGVTETRDLILKFYLTLKQIAVGNVSAKNLNGPVGIIHAGTILSTKGTDWMFWFLGLISANLAVVNFLPLPVVDGGHFCFLLWEAATGKPPSPGVQFWTQLTGLVLIAGMFLFVTYNDLSRLPIWG